MSEDRIANAPSMILQRNDLQKLLDALAGKGYQVVGPTVRDSAIVYEPISKTSELPIGWTDEQDAGAYCLKKRNDEACFGYVMGPHSWKKYLFPPHQKLWQVERGDSGFAISTEKNGAKPFAFVGVRACELAAMAITDKVFIGGPYTDTAYQERRSSAFLVAVNCGEAHKTCFCVSMNTGPRARSGFDLVMTEILEGGRHEFVIQAGTGKGEDILKKLPTRPAAIGDDQKVNEISKAAEGQMGRSIEMGGLKEILYRAAEDGHWELIAKRCLTCANCTMVCPTCFCHTVQDTTALTGDHAERWRHWDSCFNLEFSYIHGGSLRMSTMSRYRQWMTHKLAAWQDQFGSPGCVGCGRCITWCPVGIDITEEARNFRNSRHGRS